MYKPLGNEHVYDYGNKHQSLRLFMNAGIIGTLPSIGVPGYACSSNAVLDLVAVQSLFWMTRLHGKYLYRKNNPGEDVSDPKQKSLGGGLATAVSLKLNACQPLVLGRRAESDTSRSRSSVSLSPAPRLTWAVCKKDAI